MGPNAEEITDLVTNRRKPVTAGGRQGCVCSSMSPRRKGQTQPTQAVGSAVPVTAASWGFQTFVHCSDNIKHTISVMRR
jgi:hypothetical protein